MSVTQPNENNTTTEETSNTSVNQQYDTEQALAFVKQAKARLAEFVGNDPFTQFNRPNDGQPFSPSQMQQPMVRLMPNPNYNPQHRGFPGGSKYIPPNPNYGVINNKQPHRNCVQLSMETVSMAQDVLLHMSDINIALQTVQGVMAAVVNTRGNVPPNMVCGLLTDSTVRELRDILSSFVLRVNGQ